jgi:AraC-like DNA-binding protein
MDKAMENINFKPVQIKTNSISSKGKLYLEFMPAESLRKYICCYWISPIIEDAGYNPMNLTQSEIVVPDGCIDVLFGTDKHGHGCRNILVGTMSKGSIVNMEHSNIETFGIRFYPGGLQSFIQESSGAFTDKMESIDTIGPSIFTEFQKEIRRFDSIEDKINFANRYFGLKKKDSILLDNEFQNVLYRIYKAKGIIKIKDITDSEVIGEKQLRRIFHNRVGVSTKTFIKIVRFQSILRTMNLKKNNKIVELALDAGYYDESHFIHEFYKFSGMKPSEYITKL